MTAAGYAQAGGVLRDRAEPFADGAVRATMEFAEGGSAPNGFQRTIVERVLMSVTEANKRGLVTREDVERQHITETVYQLMARAPGLGQGLIRQSMGIVGLRYNLSEGRVEPVVLNGVH